MIDNGSSDASVELVALHYPNVEVHAGVNLGFAGGCNLGMRFAGGEFAAYFFVNPDTTISPTCLERLEEIFRRR